MIGGLKIKGLIKGQLNDGTTYFINEDRFIINGKSWFTGNKKEIGDYIKQLNKED